MYRTAQKGHLQLGLPQAYDACPVTTPNVWFVLKKSNVAYVEPVSVSWQESATPLEYPPPPLLHAKNILFSILSIHAALRVTLVVRLVMARANLAVRLAQPLLR